MAHTIGEVVSLLDRARNEPSAVTTYDLFFEARDKLRELLRDCSDDDELNKLEEAEEILASAASRDQKTFNWYTLVTDAMNVLQEIEEKMK